MTDENEQVFFLGNRNDENRASLHFCEVLLLL